MSFRKCNNIDKLPFLMSLIEYISNISKNEVAEQQVKGKMVCQINNINETVVYFLDF